MTLPMLTSHEEYEQAYRWYLDAEDELRRAENAYMNSRGVEVQNRTLSEFRRKNAEKKLQAIRDRVRASRRGESDADTK